MVPIENICTVENPYTDQRDSEIIQTGVTVTSDLMKCALLKLKSDFDSNK